MTRIDTTMSHVVSMWISESDRGAVEAWYDATNGMQYRARIVDATEFTKLANLPGVKIVDFRATELEMTE